MIGFFRLGHSCGTILKQPGIQDFDGLKKNDREFLQGKLAIAGATETAGNKTRIGLSQRKNPFSRDLREKLRPRDLITKFS